LRFASFRSAGSAKAPDLLNVCSYCAEFWIRHTGVDTHTTARQNSMEERRKHPRTEINQPGYVCSGGSVMSCVVRNISAEGAAIDVENPAFVPECFRLVIANEPSDVRECRIAWIQKNRIGLTFVDET
jgi:hypothetical protein